MSSLHVIRHNPALRARLAAVVQGGEPEALLAVMQQLSHSERRTASYLLATDVLLAGPPAADFPRWYTVLMASSAKAWLGTLLKAAVTLYQDGRLNLADEAWSQASAMANDIDRSKWLDAFLPILRNDADAASLMQWFAPHDRMKCSRLLIAKGTPLAYHQLFLLWRTHDGERADLHQVYVLLMRQGSPRAYNMACILRQYFGLDNAPGSLSLRLEPYQLGRLEQGFAAFAQILG